MLVLVGIFSMNASVFSIQHSVSTMFWLQYNAVDIANEDTKDLTDQELPVRQAATEPGDTHVAVLDTAGTVPESVELAFGAPVWSCLGVLEEASWKGNTGQHFEGLVDVYQMV